MRFDLILSMGDIYTNSQGRSTQFKDILPWNISNDYEDHPNQQENSHKQCDEMGHPVVNMMESQ